MAGDDLKARLGVAVEAARKAGRVTLEYFRRSDLAVERKSDGTPVTIADRLAEELLRGEIERVFPEDAIRGEEWPDRPGDSGFQWYLDPIDGTKSFVHGVPLYGTLVGVEYGGRCVLGVVVLPALGEYIYAARGQGAWHVCGESSPCRARVSEVGRLDDSLFCFTSVSEFHKRGREAGFELLRSGCRLARGWGDCYGYVLVATGRAEVMVDPVLSVWDMAALPAILEEAGGTFTDWQGNATIHGGDGVGTNGKVFEQVMAVTRGR